MQLNMMYWMESGMESDVSEHLESDEMYLMLQADMLSIKRQEKALQHDIDDISNKFKSLIVNCGLESDLQIPHSNMPNPPTPSFLCNATKSFHQITNYSTSSDEDYLLQQMMQGASLPLSDSTSGESMYDDNQKPLIIDSNCNYMASPSSDYIAPDNTAVHVPNIDYPNITESASSSDISNGSDTTTTSDGYPKSSETSSDNQCVPECVPEQDAYDLELVSRMQYYSDFTIDRQHKIDSMTAKLTNGNSNESANNSNSMDCDETEILFSRVVEGCESNTPPVMRIRQVVGVDVNDCKSSSNSGTDSSTTSSSGKYHRSSRSSNRTSSSQGSRKSSSIPRASSTMIEDFSPSSRSSGSSKHKSCSIPQASSTMIEDPTSNPSSHCGSVEDIQSIYTWSIHDGSDEEGLEDSYLRNIDGQRLVVKPPLPPKKMFSSSSSCSSYGSSKKRSNKQSHIQLDDQCSMPMIDSLSVIEPSVNYRDGALVSDSIYDDEESGFKANTLPRTSTKLNLLSSTKCSASSSLEARRASLPDILSVCTPNPEDFHSLPDSGDSGDSDASANSSPLQDRLPLPGKSSSSGSPSEVQQFPGNNTKLTNTEALIDSILTDSPTSVSSSGIFAPFNSPDATDRSNPASKTSQSTASDTKSHSPPECAAPAPIVAQKPSPVIVDKKDPEFKMPKFNQPLRKLFKFRRNKGKVFDKSSTPQHSYPSSVQSDPVTMSKRQLFTPSSSTRKSQDIYLMDKRAVIKKFKRFSVSFRSKDKHTLSRIQTLANL